MKRSILVFFVLMGELCFAQNLSIDGVYRPRFEHRDLVTVPTINSIPDFSHRARINFTYTNDTNRLKMRIVLQDARVWGNSDQKPDDDLNSLSFYEAWAEYGFTPKFSVKVGRQELSYDNELIFTHADLHQQGRSHDMLLLKYAGDIGISGGLAINNDSKLLQPYKTPYELKNYKNLQFLRLEKKTKALTASFMAVNMGLEYYDNTQTDSVQVNYLQCAGVYFKLFLSQRLFTTNSFYYQIGKDQFDLDLNAFSLITRLAYVVKPKTFIAEGGFEVYSGNSSKTELGKENNSYSIPFGSVILNTGLPGMYVMAGTDGKIAYHKGLMQPRLNLTFLHNKLTVLNKTVLPYSYGELYDATGAETSKWLGIENETYVFYKLNPEVTFNFIFGYYYMSDNMDFNPHPAFGNFANYERNPTWVIAGLIFTPKFL